MDTQGTMNQEQAGSQEFQNLISDGLMFLRSMVDYYGQNRALELWDHLNEVMGPDLKGAVMLRLLMGEDYRRCITIVGVRPGHQFSNKVQAIKAVRMLSGLGLKEAKDIIDRVVMGYREVVEVSAPGNYTTGITELRDTGLMVR
jgi:hypothetical protein